MADKDKDDAAPAEPEQDDALVEPAADADGESPPPEQDDAEPVAADSPPRPSRLPLFIALIALLAAGAAAAGVALLWMTRDTGPDPAVSGLQSALAQAGSRLDDTAAALERARRELDELGSAGDDAARELDALNRQLAERLEPLEALPGRLRAIESSLSALQGISSGLRDTWLLAEAEYYLQIGNAQLELAGNPELARIALELADERLASLGNPALTDVRRAIADELRGLRAMSDVDVAGTALTLASLADAVDSLALTQDVVEPDFSDPSVSEELSGFDRAWASLKSSLSDVISVRRSDAPVEPLLPPDAAYFLRSNVTLQLQAARLALLKGEETLYEQSLADAENWLREYFDTDTRPVESALATIGELKNARLSPVRPDISGSLALLRAFIARRVDEGRAPDVMDDGPAQ